MLQVHNAMDLFKIQKVDMVYLDPPYYSQHDYGDFNDHFKSLQDYLDFMRRVIQNCYDVLKDNCAFFLHCDWHASHYLKVICDGIFGYDCFANEIYTMRSPKNMNVMTRRLNCNTDSLFFYWKGEGVMNVKPTKPRTGEETWATPFGGGSGGPRRIGEQWIDPPRGRHYMWSQEKLDEEFKKGNLRITKNGSVQYRITSDRISIGNLWDDIPGYDYASDYNTAKSQEVLERIILMATKEGDTVFDPMCGGGVTLRTAKRLNRNYIGFDINETAIRQLKDELEPEKEVHGL